MQEVPFDQVQTMLFNGQGLLCEQLFEDNDFGGAAYNLLSNIVNTAILLGATQQQLIPLLQNRFHSISDEPFDECNRLTITQFQSTIYYEPGDILSTIIAEEENAQQMRPNLKIIGGMR